MQREFERHSEIRSFRFDDLTRHYGDVLHHPAHRSQDKANLRGVFAELLRRLEENLRFDHIGLGVYDSRRNVVSVILQAGEYEFSPEAPVVESSLGIVVQQGQPIEVGDVHTETRFTDLLERTRRSGFRSFRVVPLSNGHKIFGALGVARKQPGPFSNEDVRYLEHAAQLIALVLENSLMANVLGREKSQLEALLDVSKALASSLDLRKILEAVSASIRQIVSYDFTHLALYDKSSDSMKFHVFSPGVQPMSLPEWVVPLSECPAGTALRQGETMFFQEEDLKTMDSNYTRYLLEVGVRHVACVPLVSRGRKLGTLGLLSRNDFISLKENAALLNQLAAQLGIAVDNACAYEEISRFKDKLAKEKLYLEEELRSEHNFGEVIGQSPALKDVLKQVQIAAPSGATVLILGETGTGKELVARAVHRLSSRCDNNFIKLNCAAIPTGLLESELFGHEKGAFTGAVNQKVGRLELADKGTLFLDEIGEIPMELQPKLLRVLQDQEFERLGGVRTIKVNVRLIAATNRDLAAAVEERQFRSDLFYRLNVFPIRVPPLRERPGDIPMLVRYFVQKFARRMGKNIESIPTEIIREFEQWHWPGNVRELENFIERSVILTQGSAFFAPISELRIPSPERMKKSSSTLEDVEREYILRTLRESGGVIAGVRGAAVRLGMKRTTLQSRMQKLGITRDEYET